MSIKNFINERNANLSRNQDYYANRRVKESGGISSRQGNIDHEDLEFWIADTYRSENVPLDEKYLAAKAYQDILRNERKNAIRNGANANDDYYNFNWKNAIAGIKAQALEEGMSEEEINEAFLAGEEYYRKGQGLGIGIMNKYENFAIMSPQEKGRAITEDIFTDIGILNWDNHSRMYDEQAEESWTALKNLGKIAPRAITGILSLPKVMVADLPMMFMEEDNAAGYLRRLQNPYTQENLKKNYEDGDSLVDDTFLSGLYHMGAAFEGIREHYFNYEGDVADSFGANLVDFGAEGIVSAPLELLFMTSKARYLHKNPEYLADMAKLAKEEAVTIFDRARKYFGRQTAAQKEYGKLDELAKVGLDAVNRRSLRELAYINVGMSGSYAGLEALGGEDALNWNQEGFYQVAKIPLLFLSAIGSGSLAGRVGRSQSSNVVKRFAWMLADEGEMVPEQYLRSLGYDDKFIENLTAKDMENIVVQHFNDPAQLDQMKKMAEGIKKLKKEDRASYDELANMMDTVITERQGVLEIAARKKGFTKEDGTGDIHRLQTEKPEFANKIDLFLDQMLLSDVLRSIRKSSTSSVKLKAFQSVDLDLMRTEAQTMLKDEASQRAFMKEVLDDLLEVPEGVRSEDFAKTTSRRFLEGVKNRNDKMLAKVDSEIEDLERTLIEARDEIVVDLSSDRYESAFTGDKRTKTGRAKEDIEIKIGDQGNTEKIMAKNRINENLDYKPTYSRTEAEDDAFIENQKNWYNNAEETARTDAKDAYETAENMIGDTPINSDQLSLQMASGDYVSFSKFAAKPEAEVRGVQGISSPKSRIDRYIKKTYRDYVKSIEKDDDLLLDNLESLIGDNDRIKAAILQNEQNALDLLEGNTTVLTDLSDLSTKQLIKYNNAIINQSKNVGVDLSDAQAIIRLKDINYMHRQVNSRLRSLRTTMGVGGEEIHELGLLSSRLKDIQDAGSDLVIANIRKQGIKSTEEIDNIMTYKKASQHYHDTYVKPFMQGPGAKPRQTTFTSEILQPEIEIVGDFLRSRDVDKSFKQLKNIGQYDPEGTRELVRQSLGRHIEANESLSKETLKRLKRDEYITADEFERINSVYHSDFKLETALNDATQSIVDSARKAKMKRQGDADPVFELLNTKQTDSYSAIFDLIRDFSADRMDNFIKDLAQTYKRVDGVDPTQSVKNDLKVIVSKSIIDEVSRFSDEIKVDFDRKSFDNWKKENNLEKTNDKDAFMLWQEEIVSKSFQKVLKQNEALLKKLDPDHYEDLKKLSGFSTLVERTTTGSDVGIQQMARSLSAESLMSRVYGIVRGVVSPRYVASEITLQMYRQRQLKLMQSLISNKYTADVMAQALLEDGLTNASTTEKFLSILRGVFEISRDQITDEEFLEQAEINLGYNIPRD